MANPARATTPVAAAIHAVAGASRDAASSAVTISPTAVTAVATPIGPRSDSARKSSSRRASSPPPIRAMRSGRAATIAAAPSTMARTSSDRHRPPAGRPVSTSAAHQPPTPISAPA